MSSLDDDSLLRFLDELSNDIVNTTITIEKKKRSQTLVKKMKELYNHQCQLCNPENPIPAIEMTNDFNYVEMHHIIPISSTSIVAEDETEMILDDYKNCVVVCSHHHKMLHYHKGGFSELDEMIDGLYFINDETELKLYLNKHLFL